MKYAKLSSELTNEMYAALRKASRSGGFDVVAKGDPGSNGKDIVIMRKGPVNVRIVIETDNIQLDNGKSMKTPYDRYGMVRAYAFFTRMPGTQTGNTPMLRCVGKLSFEYTDVDSIDVEPYVDMLQNAVNLFNKIAKLVKTPVC